MYTLALETSCDETSAAVIEDGRHIRSNIISTQVPIHRKFGGVVPEIASRQHIEYVMPIIKEALDTAKVTLSDIDHIGVTYGPGLVGALLVGVAAAKAISFAADKPLVGVNHMEGHIFANFLSHPELEPPFLALVVSGGHTQLVQINDYNSFKLMGQTRDDAAGEAFDKIARVMGYPYPGGPQIEKLAKDGNPDAIEFPKALHERHNFEFSFSGLKSAVLSYLHTQEQRASPIMPPTLPPASRRPSSKPWWKRRWMPLRTAGPKKSSWPAASLPMAACRRPCRRPAIKRAMPFTIPIRSFAPITEP